MIILDQEILKMNTFLEREHTWMALKRTIPSFVFKFLLASVDGHADRWRQIKHGGYLITNQVSFSFFVFNILKETNVFYEWWQQLTFQKRFSHSVSALNAHLFLTRCQMKFIAEVGRLLDVTLFDSCPDVIRCWRVERWRRWAFAQVSSASSWPVCISY